MMITPTRSLYDLIRDERQQRIPINGLFKRLDDENRSLREQLETARKVIAFQNDVIEALRVSYTGQPVEFKP